MMTVNMDFASINKKFGKTLIILTAVSFLWLGTFGLFNHMSEMKHGGPMSGCLFNGHLEACIMNVSEHIAIWQSMMTALPQKAGFADLLALLALSAAIIVSYKNYIFDLSEFIKSRRKLYIKQHNEISFFNALSETFSQGILNPKTY
ncbi:MAG: hypothetical protein Q8P07_01885 [bacterium]|nr:hypothetical protein [bacterium]